MNIPFPTRAYQWCQQWVGASNEQSPVPIYTDSRSVTNQTFCPRSLELRQARLMHESWVSPEEVAYAAQSAAWPHSILLQLQKMA